MGDGRWGREKVEGGKGGRGEAGGERWREDRTEWRVWVGEDGV